MHDDLSKADADVVRAQAEVVRARDELRRAESAHQIAAPLLTSASRASNTRKPGLIAQQEIDEAQSRDLVAEAQVAAAKSAVAAVEEQVKLQTADTRKVKTLIDYTRVTAPFAGVITKRYADTGSMIQAGTASQTQAMPRGAALPEQHAPPDPAGSGIRRARPFTSARRWRSACRR